MGMGARGCFLTPAVKASYRPTQAGQRGDLALPAVNLQDFFFFGAHSHSPFLCLCSAVFAQGDPPIEYYGSLFCFLRCDRMRFPQTASKLTQIAVDLLSGISRSTPTGKTSHKPTQLVTQGVPVWLSYLMLSSSVHPKILSPTASGRTAPLLPGSGGW